MSEELVGPRVKVQAEIEVSQGFLTSTPMCDFGGIWQIASDVVDYFEFGEAAHSRSMVDSARLVWEDE
jgi:hypothetical protein